MFVRREIWADIVLGFIIIWAVIGVAMVTDQIMEIPTNKNNRSERLINPKDSRDYGSIEKGCIRYLERLKFEQKLKGRSYD